MHFEHIIEEHAIYPVHLGLTPPIIHLVKNYFPVFSRGLIYCEPYCLIPGVYYGLHISPNVPVIHEKELK